LIVVRKKQNTVSFFGIFWNIGINKKNASARSILIFASTPHLEGDFAL